jgi:hypothetical protein
MVALKNRQLSVSCVVNEQRRQVEAVSAIRFKASIGGTTDAIAIASIDFTSD